MKKKTCLLQQRKKFEKNEISKGDFKYFKKKKPSRRRIFKNTLCNCKNKAKGHGYNEEIEQFTLTLIFYSPRAYNYLRKFIYLSHNSLIKEWTATILYGLRSL